MSMIEAVTNVVVGFVIALVTQLAVFPRFGLQASFADNIVISGVFTVVSILRSFVLRRLFESIRLRAR
jgi:prepilin signal peptidase PulO-like enzyme (type II secretory pathway)